MPKTAKSYYCEFCEFSTFKKSNYDQHLLTRKHQNRTNSNETSSKKQQKTAEKNTLKCIHCNKKYKSRSSLWYHQKKCDPDNCEKEEDTEIMKQILDENKELRNMIKEQQQQIGEMIPKIGNNTQNFNLNVFLNENCKDALNIMDFVNSLELELADLEETGKYGYVTGISNIIMKGLKDLDLHKRPIHCSDLKRETLYIKDSDGWTKEDCQKEKMKRAIEMISRANVCQIPDWVEQNPQCQHYDDAKNEEYMNLIVNSMDSEKGEKEHSKNVDKIIKNVVKNVVLDKDLITT